MKSLKGLVTALGLLIAMDGMAGAQFEKAREMFMNARVPTIEELRVSQTWNCYSVSLRSDGSEYVELHPGLYRFIQGDGYLENDGGHFARVFRFKDDQLVSQSSGGIPGDYRDYLRMDSSTGRLIEEWTSRPSVTPFGVFGSDQPRSISNGADDRRAISYGICTNDPVR